MDDVRFKLFLNSIVIRFYFNPQIITTKQYFSFSCGTGKIIRIGAFFIQEDAVQDTGENRLEAVLRSRRSESVVATKSMARTREAHCRKLCGFLLGRLFGCEYSLV